MMLITENLYKIGWPRKYFKLFKLPVARRFIKNILDNLVKNLGNEP